MCTQCATLGRIVFIFRDFLFVRVQVYAELTSRMVMTMEWVEGARLSDRPMLDKYGLEPSRLVDTMVRNPRVTRDAFVCVPTSRLSAFYKDDTSASHHACVCDSNRHAIG